MSRRPMRPFGALVTVARLHARLLAELDRLGDASTAALEGFLQTALTDGERSELGIALYDDRSRVGPRGLFAWEEELVSALPPAPARILVGGAGTGREVEALVGRGYEVDAFEPASSLAERAAETLGGRGEVFVGRYEELNAAVLEGASGPLAPLAARRYDVIWLGWGSLGHVLEPEERARLFRACRVLCPRGPIVASFWLRDGGTLPPRSRAGAAGGDLGRFVSRLRPRPTSATDDGYRPHLGFVHAFTPEELASLASAAGLECVLEAAPYPHALLWPADARGSERRARTSS